MSMRSPEITPEIDMENKPISIGKEAIRHPKAEDPYEFYEKMKYGISFRECSNHIDLLEELGCLKVKGRSRDSRSKGAEGSSDPQEYDLADILNGDIIDEIAEQKGSILTVIFNAGNGSYTAELYPPFSDIFKSELIKRELEEQKN